MFEILVGAKTKFKYELQGLFTTDRIYLSIIYNLSIIVCRRVLFLDTNAV